MEEALIGDSAAIFGKGEIWRLLSATFLHDRLWLPHLLFNMFMLFFLGRELEPALGARDYAATYLMAGIFSTLVQTFVYRYVQGDTSCLGASGAIGALFAIMALRQPHREVLLFFVLRTPFWLLLAVFVSLDALIFVAKLAGQPSEQTAAGAHLAGALFGWLTNRYDLRWGSLPRLPRLGRRRAKPRVRVIHPDDFEDDLDAPLPGPSRARGASAASASGPSATAARPRAPREQEELLEARLDEVLQKIAREGRAGLTAAENEVLDAASRRARERRDARR